MQHGLGREAAVVAARTAEPGECVAASARQTGVSSRDAYLFLDLADEADVVAGRFLKESAVRLNDLFDYGRLDVERPQIIGFYKGVYSGFFPIQL